MQRRGRLLLLALVGSTGCSLVLDFDDPPPPADASQPDAILEAACSYGEPNDQASMAAPLSPGNGIGAAICDDGDHDFYSVTVAEGQALSFEVLFEQQGPRGDLDLRLFDVNVDMVSQSLSTNADEKIVCPGEGPHCPQLAAGNYFVEVYAYAATTKNAYTINFSLTP